MPLLPCLIPGCGQLVPKGTRGRRCPVHRRQVEQARGTRQQRGYDSRHDRLRAQYQRRMDAGERFRCWRCGEPIRPDSWHLGHDDHDRGQYRGPECPGCNQATKGRELTAMPARWRGEEGARAGG